MRGINSMKWSSKKSILALVLVGATFGLTGCGGNPLLDKETRGELREAMSDSYMVDKDAAGCVNYYEKPSSAPDKKEKCDEWSAKKFNQLKTRQDFIPDNATIEDFRDADLWKKINPNSKG